MPRDISRRHAIGAGFGLFLTVGLPLLRANEYGEWFLHLSPLASRDLFWWPLTIGILLYVRFVEDRSFASIGLRNPDGWTVPIGLGLALFSHYVLVWAGSFIVTKFHLPTGGASNAALAIDTSPLWYRILIVTRGGFGEEVIFRGYLIERIEELTRSRILAGTVSVVVFSLAHLAYWGWTPLVFVTLAGILLTVVYQWRRDLWSNIIGHWLADALPVLLHV